MFGLSLVEAVVLILYLLGVTTNGILAARRVKNTSDFILPRRFGKLMMMRYAFGTSTHSDQAVSVASKSSVSDLSGIWYQWMWLFATPFFWLIAPMMRRFRALTTANVFDLRYDGGVAFLYSILDLGKFMVTIGLILARSTAIIDAVTEGKLPSSAIILVMTALFVVSGMAGELGTAIVTDFIQGILTLLFSFMLFPVAYIGVGFAAGIGVSLFSRPVQQEKLDRFYNLLRTPVMPGEVITEPCTLPEEVEAGPRNVFFPNSSFEIPMPSRQGILGLLAGWACVFAIIGAVVVWMTD